LIDCNIEPVLLKFHPTKLLDVTALIAADEVTAYDELKAYDADVALEALILLDANDALNDTNGVPTIPLALTFSAQDAVLAYDADVILPSTTLAVSAYDAVTAADAVVNAKGAKILLLAVICPCTISPFFTFNSFAIICFSRYSTS
jgi:hypothetical protein